MSANDFIPSKHVINWIMVKVADDQAAPREGQQRLKPKIFFSTLEYAEIPTSPADLFDYCINSLSRNGIPYVMPQKSIQRRW
jgi:hypothetical protein